MQIDDSLARPWPEQVARAAQVFRQGHLVESPPVFFACNADYPICRTTGDLLLDCVASSSIEAPYAVITTQSCDIAEQGLPKKAWVQVAPVFRLTDNASGQAEQILRHEIGHLYPLSPTGLEEGVWVADLRIELPVEKSWLVGRDPIPAFATEKGARDFAIHIGKLRSRPALGNDVARIVVSSLHSAMRKAGNLSERNELFGPVRDLWLRLMGSSWENPSGGTLFVAVEIPPSENLMAFFERWFESVLAPSIQIGCPLQGNQYLDLREVPAVDYLDLTESMLRLEFKSLSSD